MFSRKFLLKLVAPFYIEPYLSYQFQFQIASSTLRIHSFFTRKLFLPVLKLSYLSHNSSIKTALRLSQQKFLSSHVLHMRINRTEKPHVHLKRR